jgi:V/A-type H+-transporting ATPase subunit K
MTILTFLLSASALGILLSGIYFMIYPESAHRLTPRWMKTGVAVNLLLFVLGIGAFLIGGVLIGIGLPTALATIGAGIAVSSVGSASLAVIAEKPELFGRTLIYLGLAEGIAIYGLVVSILLLGKI